MSAETTLPSLQAGELGISSLGNVAPGLSEVISLEPEFITPQDGHDKQDCENAAAKRWITAHARNSQDPPVT